MSDQFNAYEFQHLPLNVELLPPGWMLTNLNNIAEVIEPGFASGKQDQDENGVPHLRPMNISREGKIELDVVKKVPPREDKSLRVNDVLFNNTNSPELVGKTSLIGPASMGFAFSNHMTRLTLFMPIESRYVAYYLHYLWQTGYTKHRCTNHVNQASISTSTLGSSFPFLLPPEREQTRIVEKLEELLSDLDNGVAELKAAQAKLTQYRQSLLKSAVEGSLTAEWRSQNTPSETGAQLLERILKERRQRWEQQKLAEFKTKNQKPPKDWQKKYPELVKPDTSDLPELPEGWVWASIEQVTSDEPYSLAIGPFGSNLKVSDYKEKGVPLVFVRNIRSGNYGGEFTKFISAEKAKELSAHSVSPGDVVITKMGEPPGDADVFPDSQPASIITADCIKVRCYPVLMYPELLKISINSWIGKKQIEPITKGVAQKKVSLGRFSHIAVPIPPIDEQMEILSLSRKKTLEINDKLNSVDLALLQSSVQRKNILKDAFSGKLVEQNSNDEPASMLLEKIKVERSLRDNKPKIQRQKKKAKRMKKLEIEAVKSWIKTQDRAFSFETFRSDFDGSYEVLKNIMFGLLEEERPLIKQIFDQKRKCVVFERIE